MNHSSKLLATMIVITSISGDVQGCFSKKTCPSTPKCPNCPPSTSNSNTTCPTCPIQTVSSAPNCSTCPTCSLTTTCPPTPTTPPPPTCPTCPTCSTCHNSTCPTITAPTTIPTCQTETTIVNTTSSPTGMSKEDILNDKIHKIDENLEAIGGLKTAIDSIDDRLKALPVEARKKRSNSEQPSDDLLLELLDDLLLELLDEGIKLIENCGNGNSCDSNKVKDNTKSLTSTFNKIEERGTVGSDFQKSFDEKKEKLDPSISIAEKTQGEEKAKALDALSSVQGTCNIEEDVKYVNNEGSGNNINSTIVNGKDDCLKWCKDNIECKVWSFRISNKMCWIKKELIDRENNTDFISGNKICDLTTQRGTCNIEENVKYVNNEGSGNNINSTVVDGIDACLKWCKDTMECKVWSFRISNKMCWIKNELFDRENNTDFISGNKICESTAPTGTCNIENDVKYVNYEGSGNNINSTIVDGKDACLEWCKDTMECKVWSFRISNKMCWIKKELIDRQNNTDFISGNCNF